MTQNTTSAGAPTSESDLVRASRDGDQFHYHWAARHCLSLLPGTSDLVAISIEGASAAEGPGSANEGDELIDVGLYFGSEELNEARLVHYVQLKHSTLQAQKPWTASCLNKTLPGFSERFMELRKQFTWDVLKDKLRFTFTTNRPIDQKVTETLEDLAAGNTARHSPVGKTLLGYVKGLGSETANFFKLFSVEGVEPDLWSQRNLLFKDVRTFLAEADTDAPLQLKELVTRKATSEYASNPSIRRFDVLRALRTDEADLWPAECLIAEPADGAFPREQERELRTILESATHPVVLHAEGGVGKSILMWQLSKSVPEGSVAVLYDCFGDGLYRSAQHFRHRQKDALPQIANELAAQGLCYPLIPVRGTDSKQYMRAFVARLTQAISLLRAKTPVANLYLIVDAADNAVMAAKEFDDAAFVPDLIRTAMPDGIKLILSCRTHRRDYLQAPPDATHVEVRPFSLMETARHLKKSYPDATERDVADFGFLSSSNPRVQALALSRKLPLEEMLKALGPSPSTVELAISEQLSRAVEKLKFRVGHVEAEQIDLICQGLAVLRPLVPIEVLAEISGTTESAVRSFAFDLGRPLLVKGSSLHFLDEPSETWFRQNFQPDKEKLATFLDRLKPLSTSSSYVSSTIPQLLLEARQMDELVDLALSSEGLPTANPLERRDVEVQRLTFALKACLQEKRYASAAKLTLKVAGELAGVERQNVLIQRNTDIASVLLSPDRIDELVSRRAFGGNWTGAHHAYEAGLLAGREEFLADARCRLRMAIDWLYSWARMPHVEREKANEHVETSDMVELAMAKLLAEGPQDAVRFLTGWRPRSNSMVVGSILARRLVDLGRYDLLDLLAEHGVRDIWLMLGLAVEACEGGHTLPAKPVESLMRRLSNHRIQLQDPDEPPINWSVLSGVTSSVLQALRVLPRDDLTWASVIRRYLPEHPPRELGERYDTDRSVLLRAYTLEAELLGRQLVLIDLAPKEIREELEKKQSHYRSSSIVDTFERSTGGILAWFRLSAEIACGKTPAEFSAAVQEAINATNAASSKYYNNDINLNQVAALEWLRAMRDSSNSDAALMSTFRKWFEENANGFGPTVMAAVCRLAARTKHLQSLALEVSVKAYEVIEKHREHAEYRVESYQTLARAIFTASIAEARSYFERAVEMSNRIGQENLDRWGALLCLAEASGKNSSARPESAYRLARGAELAYEYVERDKHFDWGHTIDGLLSLCPTSTIAILSRWRDRNFGNADRLLKIAIDRLVKRGLMPHIAPIALCPIGDEWARDEDLAKALEQESDWDIKRKIFDVGYRYLRVSSLSENEIERVSELARSCNFIASDIDRLLSVARQSKREGGNSVRQYMPEATEKRNVPDWDVLFKEIDFTNSVELRTAYLLLKTFDPPYKTDEFYREALHRCGLGSAAEFCQAVAQWPEFGNYQLRHLFEVLGEYSTKPVALRKAMAEVTLAVCQSSPELALRRSWGGLFPYRRLISEGIVNDEQIVEATLQGFLVKVTTLDAGELFQMLESLSIRLTSDEADDALQFGLSLLEMDLRPEDGDGPWSDVMKTQGGCEDALAGYLWAVLGSPSTSVRWQAAHAVRATIELGWVPVLTALAKVAVVSAPGAFVDKRFVFYEWHSRLWLNIALARCAAEHRDAVFLFNEYLLASAKEEHVLIRHFAACSLHELSELLGESNTRVSPEKINASELPLLEYASYRAPEMEPVVSVDSTGEVVDKYYFSNDIGPYWFNSLGLVFGISQSGITKRAIQVISERMGCLTTKHEHDARYTNGVFRHERTGHSQGTMPRVEDLRAYCAYHAMMIVAARLLKTHPVGKATYSSANEFDEWIKHRILIRKDGKWAADRRDPQLTRVPPVPEKYGDKDWRWQVTTDYLDSLMETDEGLQVVAGDWESGLNGFLENISVSSVLVPKVSAGAFLCAAQTSSSPRGYFFQLGEDQVPLDEDEDQISNGEVPELAWEVPHRSQFMLRRWISDREDSYGIDEYDPWAEHVRVPSEAPNDSTISAMGLTSVDDGRIWEAKSGALLRSETWTQLIGYGSEKVMTPGTRLSANIVFLKELIAANPEHYLVVGLSLYRRLPNHDSDIDEYSLNIPPYIRYYLIEEDGIARTLKSSD
ncbi:AVAST type 3 anti-phage nuclease/ATPase Avs3a [Leeia oryzae]|uniref:AVAST type 3 anti-phage nuclease/ATPase Avs3a n=1 Tax=Leeia oryzae TaxID=356662 RepID=UPI00035D1A1F|nr:AVAST type 3 anti-phage nuclease/ATPase Avs3a [Leeia oryzae]